MVIILSELIKNNRMDYDTNLWDDYTDENEKGINFQADISKFIYFLSLGLGARKICEAGCNVGNNLSSFPHNTKVYGIDMNKYALEKAQKRFPTFTFKNENINNTSYPDSFFDLVFTRGVLIHITKDGVDAVLNELLRISNRWIFNLEYFGEDGKMINWKRGDNLLWYRNMKERWSKFNVNIISDIDIPPEIDSGNMKLTLVEKRLSSLSNENTM